MYKNLPLFALMLSSTIAAAAQDRPASPYRGMEDREIKALSAEEMAGLLTGEGMSLALAAELNGYPGPKHVLELSDSLDLSQDQRARTHAIFDAMQVNARELGSRIVDAERQLDELFATRAIEGDRLMQLTASIGSLRGELRAVHLRAHLEMTDLLTEHQVMRYTQLRGYGQSGHVHGHVPGK